MKEKLSIIVPVYNAEKYISRCIESILNSSYPHIELILIDDASMDASLNICKRYKEKDDRIVLITKRNNEGPAAARMQGLETVTGTYIGFADADDFVEKDFYKNMMYEITSEKADIVIGGWTRIFRNKKTISLRQGEKTFFDNINAITHMFKGDLFNTVLWDKIYKKELFKNIVIQKCNGGGDDMSWNVQLFFFANKILYAPNYLYNYEIYNQSLSHRKVHIKDFEYEYYQRLLKHYQDTNLFQIIAYVYSRYILIFFIRLIRSNAVPHELYAVKKVLRSNFSLFFTNPYLSLRWKVRLVLSLILPRSIIKFFLPPLRF